MLHGHRKAKLALVVILAQYKNIIAKESNPKNLAPNKSNENLSLSVSPPQNHFKTPDMLRGIVKHKYINKDSLLRNTLLSSTINFGSLRNQPGAKDCTWWTHQQQCSPRSGLAFEVVSQKKGQDGASASLGRDFSCRWAFPFHSYLSFCWMAFHSYIYYTYYSLFSLLWTMEYWRLIMCSHFTSVLLLPL